MATEIDSLQIEITAKAQTANRAIDALVGRLDVLSKSLGKINSGSTNITGLANGVDRLGRAMQSMNAVKTADFTRLTNNLAKLGTVNVSALNSTASSLSHLTRAFNTLGAASKNAQEVGTLANSLSKLGYKSVDKAVMNIPLLATALNNLMVTLSKAPKVSQNVIQMTNALANLSAQGSKVGSASRNIQNGLNKVSVSATKSTRSVKSLAAMFGTFYANAFLFIRGIKALYNSISSTADYIEAYNYFNVALGKIGSDWADQWEKYAEEVGVSSAEEYADSFSERLKERLRGLSGLEINVDDTGSGLLTETGLQNLGLNIQEVTQYASQLASVTNSVGQVGEVSLATASSLTKLGADLSSLFNLDYSEVMNNLQSGLIGQSRALYKYGIDITNATLQTYAYELGLTKAVSEMSQMEKMQLRLIAILDQSKVSWGDLANTINSPSNMMRQFLNNLKEVGMVLGQLFIPLLQKVMPVINGVTIVIKRLLVSMANLLGIKLDLDSFGQGFSGLDEDAEGLSDSLDGVSKSAKKAYMGLLGFDKLNVIKTPDDANKSKGSGVGGDTIDLTDEILDATKEYEKSWQDAFDQMENKAQDFADIIEKIFKPIADIIKEDFEDIEWEAISENIGDLSEALQPYAENFGKGLLDFFEDLGDISVTTINSLFGEDGSVTKLTDWLNKENPKKAENWGYAFGVISTGLLGFAGLAGVANVLTLLAKGIGLFVSPLGKLIGLAKGSSALAGLSTALSSLGGIGGLFTMDLGLIFGAGTAMEIGLTIGAGLISGLVAAWAGFNFGKWLGEKLFPEDAQWYEEFKWFGEGGFFQMVFGDLETTIKAVQTMSSDFQEIPFIKSMIGFANTNYIGDIINLFTVLKDEIATFSLQSVTDDFLKWAEDILSIFSGLFSGITEMFSIDPFVSGNKLGNIGIGIKGFAGGGYPNEYSLFMAGEHGRAEMLGTVGGKTAVAGGAEITGIREEIRNTANEEIALLRQQNALLQGILEKEFGITKDAVGRATQSWARDYSKRTGRPAFN